MLLKYRIRNKNLLNILFASLFLPYFLLCLTVGGFHGGVFNEKQCSHTKQLQHQNNHDHQIGILGDVSQHHSETCQICQWLKTPSITAQFLTVDAHFDFVYISSPRDSNPILPSLSIHKFTIRPPPYPCFPA